jgi:hypothetical protein
MYSDEKVGPEFSDRSAFRFLGVMSDFHWAFPEFGRQSPFGTAIDQGGQRRAMRGRQRRHPEGLLAGSGPAKYFHPAELTK